MGKQNLSIKPRPEEVVGLVNFINTYFQKTQKKRIQEVTANYTILLDEDHTVLADATSGVITITLPLAKTSDEYIFNIKKVDSSANAVTVDGNGSETIDGATTYSLSAQYDSVTIQSDGTEWWIL